MNTPDIIWEAPPPKRTRRRGAERTQWLAALKVYPGQWAKWPHPVTAGSTAWPRAHGCEVALRLIEGSDSKRYDLYARYVRQDGEA